VTTFININILAVCTIQKFGIGIFLIFCAHFFF